MFNLEKGFSTKMMGYFFFYFFFYEDEKDKRKSLPAPRERGRVIRKSTHIFARGQQCGLIIQREWGVPQKVEEEKKEKNCRSRGQRSGIGKYIQHFWLEISLHSVGARWWGKKGKENHKLYFQDHHFFNLLLHKVVYSLIWKTGITP